jgi:sulfite exporter TauE/SafE
MNVAIVLSGVATVAWLVAIGVIALAVFRATRGQPFKAAGWIIVAAVVIASTGFELGGPVSGECDRVSNFTPDLHHVHCT